MKRKWLLLFGALFLAGCETTASPQFVAGHYYMTGDSACKKFVWRDGVPAIGCFNEKGQKTGLRRPMTDQQLYVYQSNQAIAAQQNAAMSAQIAANNAALNAQTAAAYNRSSNNFGVQPIAPPGGYQVRCLSNGFYTNCR